MIDDFVLDKVLDKIKEIIGIEKFEDTKILNILIHNFLCQTVSIFTLYILLILLAA